MIFRTKFRDRATSIVLPVDTVGKLDELSGQTELNRSEVVTKLLERDLDDEETLEAVFGKLEKDEEDDDEEEESEEEE